MQFIQRTILLVFVIISMIPVNSYARRRNLTPGYLRFLSHVEYNYSYVSATGRMSGRSQVYDLNTGSYVENKFASFDRKITAKTGIGMGGSVYFPLKRLGSKSCMALSVEMNENVFIWGNLNAAYTTTGSFYSGSTEIFGETIQMSAPVGLDFKFGCDALSTKSYRLCGTVGAGVKGSLNGTIIIGSENDGAGLGLGINPYVKGEVGVRAGICWKLRLMFAFGNTKYINEKSSFSDGNINVTGKTHTTLSLVIMPFSFLWKRQSWADSPEYY